MILGGFKVILLKASNFNSQFFSNYISNQPLNKHFLSRKHNSLIVKSTPSTENIPIDQ